MKRLTPYVSALPPGTKVNVNTAAVEVLEAAIPGLVRGTALQVIDRRKDKPISILAELERILRAQVRAEPNRVFEVKSPYFSARGLVTLGRVTVSYRAILARGSGTWPRTIAMYGEPL